MPGGPPGGSGPGRDPARGRGARVPRDAALRGDRGVPRGRGGLPPDRVGGGVHRENRRRGRAALMAKITPELIRKLRELSGAGMLDCKQALEETDGDVD